MTTDPDLPPIAAAIHGEDTSLDFQAHKAAFFFKLERELEKVCPINITIVSSTCLLRYTLADQRLLSPEGSGTQAPPRDPAFQASCGRAEDPTRSHGRRDN